MKHQTISVTEFKAKCLALLEEIGEHGGTITVTKRGRPLATVKRARKAAWKSPEGALAGKLDIPEDFDFDISHLWECARPGAADEI